MFGFGIQDVILAFIALLLLFGFTAWMMRRREETPQVKRINNLYLLCFQLSLYMH